MNTNKKPGRPKKVSQPVDVTVYLEVYQLVWLKKQTKSISETVRGLVDKAIVDKTRKGNKNE